MDAIAAALGVKTPFFPAFFGLARLSLFLRANGPFWLKLRQPVKMGPLEMKHRNSHFAVGYWSRIRHGRPVPDQADIDPKALKRLLPFVFLLDARPDGMITNAVFRSTFYTAEELPMV